MNRIGKGMARARSEAEFHELVKETIYEIEDIHRAYEFDKEFMSDTFMITEKIEPELRTLNEQLSNNLYEFNGQGLSFFDNLQQVPADIIPIKSLLIRIHETLMHGLE